MAAPAETRRAGLDPPLPATRTDSTPRDKIPTRATTGKKGSGCRLERIREDRIVDQARDRDAVVALSDPGRTHQHAAVARG